MLKNKLENYPLSTMLCEKLNISFYYFYKHCSGVYWFILIHEHALVYMMNSKLIKKKKIMPIGWSM